MPTNPPGSTVSPGSTDALVDVNDDDLHRILAGAAALGLLKDAPALDGQPVEQLTWPAIERGWQTSEGQRSIIASALAALIALATLVRHGFTVPTGTQTQIVTVALGVVALVEVAYTVARARVKVAALRSAEVVKAPGQ